MAFAVVVIFAAVALDATPVKLAEIPAGAFKIPVEGLTVGILLLQITA